MGWPQNINITLREPLAISEKWPIGTDDSIKMGIENNERIKNLSIQSQKAYIKAQNELYGYIPVIILNLIGTANKGKGEVMLAGHIQVVNTERMLRYLLECSGLSLMVLKI